MNDTPQELKPNAYRSCVNCGKDIYYDYDGNWLHCCDHKADCSDLRAQPRAPSVSPQVDEAARPDVWEQAIAIVRPWADAYKSCQEHFNDPCCHVRLATTIVDAIEAARDAQKQV